MGNKSDLELQRNVRQEDGMMLAKKFNMGFFETSSKFRTNVEETFYELVRRIRRQKSQDEPEKVKSIPGVAVVCVASGCPCSQ